MELFPIGTKLTTVRISQAAKYFELYGDYNMTTETIEDRFPRKGFCDRGFHVEVGSKFQRSVSPAAMVGDIVKSSIGKIIAVNTESDIPLEYTVLLRYHPPSKKLIQPVEWDRIA